MRRHDISRCRFFRGWLKGLAHKHSEHKLNPLLILTKHIREETNELCQEIMLVINHSNNID